MRKHKTRRQAVVYVLRTARQKAGMSQRALSKKLGEALTYMHEIETEQHGVRVEEFIAIAQALDLDPAELLCDVLNIPEGKPSTLLLRGSEAEHQRKK